MRSAGGGDHAEGGMADDTAQRLQGLEEKVDELLRRVAELETAPPVLRAGPTKPPDAPLQPVVWAPKSAPPPVPPAADQPVDSGGSQFDLEDLLGGRVLGWI